MPFALWVLTTVLSPSAQERLDAFEDPLPEAAVARLGTVRFRHGFYLNALAVSPDGAVLAGAGWDHTIHLWDMRTGRERMRFPGHCDSVYAVTFSPDGARIASGGLDGAVMLWSAADGKRLRKIPAHKSSAGAVAFSPDGSKMASGGYDKIVRLWDADSGRRIREFEGHGDPVKAVAFSPDGGTLASGSGTEGGTDPSIRFWDVESGEEKLKIDHGSPVSSLSFSPDGARLLAGSGDGATRMWNVESGSELWSVANRGSLAAFSPDGKTFATRTESGRIGLFDGETYEPIREMTMLRFGGTIFAFSPDGKRLAMTGSMRNAVRVFDVESGEPLNAVEAHEGAVWSLAASPDGKTIYSADFAGTIRSWDAETYAPGRTIKLQNHWIGRITVSPDGRRLAGYANGELRMWDAAEGKELGPGVKPRAHVTGMSFSPDGRTLATGCQLWGVSEDGALTVVREWEGYPHDVAYSPDGSTLAISDQVNELRLRQASTGREFLEIEGQKDGMPSVVFSPDGRFLATGGGLPPNTYSDPSRLDTSVRMWEVVSGQEIFSFKGHTDSVYGVAFSPDGTRIASTGADGTVRLWDAVTGEALVTLNGHDGHASSVIFTAGGDRLVSGGWDTTLLVWDVSRFRAVAPVKPPDAIEAVWDNLAGDDARRAFSAVHAMAAGGEAAVSFLELRLAPADTKRAAELASRLDDEDASVADAAHRGLIEMGRQADPVLREVQAKTESYDLKSRIKEILQTMENPFSESPETRRRVRAVHALELIGTPAARRVLEAFGTRDAQGALGRMKH